MSAAGAPTAIVAVDSRRHAWLALALSALAGSVDVIGFLGIGGLFVAHITGNVIILAAHVVAGSSIDIATLLSVPVFALGLGLVRALIGRWEVRRHPLLRALLWLQLVLVGCFAVLAIAGGNAAADSPRLVAAGMAGVLAKATQNATTQVPLHGGPSTAVMTTNLTRFAMDVGELLVGHDETAGSAARRRLASTGPALVGFVSGAAVSAALYAAVGFASLMFPIAIAALCVAMS